jgi:hypothetical protein
MKYIFLVILTLFFLSVILDKMVRIFKPKNRESQIKKKRYLLVIIFVFVISFMTYLVLSVIYKNTSYGIYAGLSLLLAAMTQKHRNLIHI